MRNIFFYIFIITLFSCDIEDAKDCLRSHSEKETYEQTIIAIEEVIVRRDIQLSVKQSTENKLEIITDQKSFENLNIEFNNQTLELSLDNVCPFGNSEPFAEIVLHVTDIRQIRNSSQYTIQSLGQLNFPFLRLISESYNDNDALNSGDFKMDIDVNNFGIVSSGISDFYITGKTNKMSLGFYDGSGAFYGENLQAQEVDIFYRSSRNSQLNVQQKAVGEIRSTGSIYFQQTPNNLAIECFYTGCWFVTD
ncbi:GIN domain-containing protein [Psychroflexus halocasei]|uniref:Putative auto-transporter adhesin, head GIN domain n=1 Tax=Psychroflexus halocasei TaxID=908615 RepID=A0A1H4CYX5_9FLAO|nr:DUF2807 domain-containing protein [Psychroflexus halocasei]SEA65446.1 Putative auto-transporter adhesin, head GIN domain [Psychroflexus halocasei]